MCAVSYVGEQYMFKYPRPEDWDRQRYDEYKRLREMMAEYDKITNQPDCPDPVKEDFFKKVLDRLERLEKKVDNLTPVPVVLPQGGYEVTDTKVTWHQLGHGVSFEDK